MQELICRIRRKLFGTHFVWMQYAGHYGYFKAKQVGGKWYVKTPGGWEDYEHCRRAIGAATFAYYDGTPASD